MFLFFENNNSYVRYLLLLLLLKSIKGIIEVFICSD